MSEDLIPLMRRLDATDADAEIAAILTHLDERQMAGDWNGLSKAFDSIDVETHPYMSLGAVLRYTFLSRELIANRSWFRLLDRSYLSLRRREPERDKLFLGLHKYLSQENNMREN